MYALDLSTASWRKSSRSTDQANCVEIAHLACGWRKSSYSTTNANCVEVARGWRKSSCSSDNANCVEVAFEGPAVAVRDSKNPTGPVLAFPAVRWRVFVGNDPQ